MDGIQQLGLPILGIIAAATVTFYAVSFSELSEKSFRDLDDKEESDFKPSLSSRQRRARRNAQKQANKSSKNG